jgi:hypothetical protein
MIFLLILNFGLLYYYFFWRTLFCFMRAPYYNVRIKI